MHEAAKAIGSALGAIAAKVGVTRAHGEEQPKKIGKLVSKAKERLPRKKKKKLAKKTSLAKSSQG